MMDAIIDILSVDLLYIGYAILFIAMAIEFVQKRALDKREAGLEKYAHGLDDWERKLKVQGITLNGYVRYCRKMAEEDLKLKERLEAIKLDDKE